MFNKIVWATDGSAGADHALGYARDLARTTGAELVVVHSEEMSAARSSIGYTRRVDEVDLEAKINRQVSELTDGGIPVSVKVIGGHAHPATLIAEVAQDVGADLVVVGTRGHTPLAGLMLGSVTDRLLHILRCPVLAVPSAKPGQPSLPATANRAESSPAWALDEVAAMAAAGGVPGARAAAATLAPFWDTALGGRTPQSRGSIFDPALRAADAVADADTAAMLLRPFRIEDLDHESVDSFGTIAGRYGQPWTAEQVQRPPGRIGSHRSHSGHFTDAQPRRRAPGGPWQDPADPAESP